MGDTLPLFREIFSEEESYTLSKLCEKRIGHVYDAHDAAEDCKALKLLTVNALHCKPSVSLQSYCWNITSLMQDVQYKNDQHQRYATLMNLVEEKIISKAMGMKIAGSGLTSGHLKKIVERSGLDALSAVFKAKCGKSCRVTTVKKIIDSVFQHFNST
jgi:hypothetical protein